MKHKALAVLSGLLLCAFGGVDAGAQPRPPGPGPGGGGFERPLADSPRRGNPGASPTLTEADLKEIVAHRKDFDENRDGKLSKAELPEMFAGLFARADANHDGLLDEAEMNRVGTASGTANPPQYDPRPRPPAGPGPGGAPPNQPRRESR
jgi:hypothetical protein